MIRKNAHKHDELVSVLMTVYNTDIGFLSEAVQSVLNQSYKNIELVLIDDCSSSRETLEYLNNLRDSRIRVYHNEINMGLTKSLNRGLDFCVGRYVARLDSDDIANRTRIERQLKSIQRKKCILMSCNWEIFPTKERHPLYIYDHYGYKVAMIFGNKGPCHSTFFIDKVRMDKIGLKYDEKFQTSQDYAFLCDCLSNGERIGFCREKLVKWRKHAGQISDKKKLKQQDDANNIRANYLLNNFNIDEADIDVFKKYINDCMYEYNVDLEQVQYTLSRFLINNKSRYVDREVYKFWFTQAIRRIKKFRKYDFLATKIFYQSLRVDRMIYTCFFCLMERIHYITR